MMTTSADAQSENSMASVSLEPQKQRKAFVIQELATLPEKALVGESDLARFFRVTDRTIRRMVARAELPPPFSLCGRSTWFAGKVLLHLESMADRAAKSAEKREKARSALFSN